MIDKITEEKLHNIKVKQLEYIRLDCTLNTLDLSLSNSSLRAFVSAAKNTVFTRHKVVQEGKGVAFLYSSDYGNRSDHILRFTKLTDLFPEALVIMPRKGFDFTGLQHLITYFSFFKAFKKDFNKKQASSIVLELYLAYVESTRIIKILEKNNINKLIVFCDIHPIDSMVVQMCHKKGIKTATLQHGHYAINSPAFKYSLSDIFIGFGTYTLRIAEKSGFDITRFKKAGMLDMINCDLPAHISSADNHVLTVFLSGIIEEDQALLNLTEPFVEEGYKRFIKPHPGNTAADYDYTWHKGDLVTSEYAVAELFDLSDFAVVAGGSTVFAEGIIKLAPVFLFDYQKVRFPELDCPRFSNYDELIKLVQEAQRDSLAFENKLIDIRREITETDNVEKRYFEIIEEM